MERIYALFEKIVFAGGSDFDTEKAVWFRDIIFPFRESMRKKRPRTRTGIDMVSPEFTKRVADRIRALNVQEMERRKLRREQALKEAERLARCITEADPDVTGLWLFGSAATGEGFREDSDIDLELQGGDVLKAIKTAEDSMFPVDVVDFDALHASFRYLIMEYGIKLYEKP
ncbi:MAG: nucleotidyltransferase domain-containing protein [Spirochaetota bacterium]